MRLESGGQAPPFRLRFLDLRSQVLALGERLCELLPRRCVSIFERCTFLLVLSLPLPAQLVLHLESGGQTPPFHLRFLDLCGQVLAFGERPCELLARRCVSTFEPGTRLLVLSFPMLALFILCLDRGGQAPPFGLRFLDLRGQVLAFGERLCELLARACLPFLEPGASLPVLSLPPLALCDMRLESGGQALPFGLRLFDLRGEVLAFGERPCELLARRCVSGFEPGAFLPILSLPLPALLVLHLEGRGQTLPFRLRLLDLPGQALPFNQRLCELFARRCVSIFEPGIVLPVLSLPALALLVLRLEGGGQTLAFRLRLLDLRGQVLPFGKRLSELFARRSLSGFERGTFLMVLSLPPLALCVLRVEGGDQTLPFRLVLLDLHGQILPFGLRLFELLAGFGSFPTVTANPLAPEGSLEPMRERGITKAEQQRVDTVRMVFDRDALKEHRARGALRDRHLAFYGGGTPCPDSVGVFLPVFPVARDEAIRQGGVQDRPERVDVEQPKGGVITGEEHAVPAHANEAARLPLEQLTQVRGVRRWSKWKCRRRDNRSAQAQFTHRT